MMKPKNVILFLLLVCKVDFSISQQKEEHDEYTAVIACLKEAKVTQEEFHDLYERNHTRVKCVDACFLKKLGFELRNKKVDTKQVISRLKKAYEQEIKIWQYALEKIEECKSFGIDNLKDECANAHEFCLCKNKIERNEHAYS